METKRNLKDSPCLNGVLKCACFIVILTSITSCESGGSSASASAPPPQISENYCEENKLVVEKLSSNAINKEVAIVGAGTGVGCGVLVLLTAGADLGALAGICTVAVAGATAWKMLAMDEATIIRNVVSEHLDPRCATLQK